MPCYQRKLSKSIKWFYKFDFASKTYISKCIYLSKREAQQAERERYNQLDEERRFGKSDKPLPLITCIKDRVHYLKVKFSQSHAIDSEYYLDLFSAELGNPDIREISRKDVESFLLSYSEKLLNNGADNYQVNAALKSIKSLFNFIIDSNDLTIKNPCKNIKPYPVKRKLKYIPSDEEIDFVRSKLNKRQLLLFDFVLQSGCRINEALNLTFNDIKDSYLIFYTNKSKNSDRVPRKADIPDCIKGLKGIGRVFPEWNDTPKFLDKVLRANEMKVWGWHSLRHRYASLLSKSNTPIYEIMNKLGHSSLKTTQGYLQMLGD